MKSNEEPRIPNVDVMDDVEIIDFMYQVYADTNERVGGFVTDLSEIKQEDMLRKIAPFFTDATMPMPEEAYELYVNEIVGGQLKDMVANYDITSRFIFNRFYKDAKKGTPGNLIGLVKVLQDPKLAKDLLAILTKENVGVYLDSLADGGGVFVEDPLWHNGKFTTEVTDSAKRYVEYGAFVISGKIKTKRARKKAFREEIIQPLIEISSMPPIWLQLLWANLNGEPLDT